MRMLALQAAFLEHRKQVMAYPGNRNGAMGAKLLVSASGVDDIVMTATEDWFHQWALKSGINVISFTSARGYFTNGKEVQRKEALETLRGLSDADSAIILQYDILTEGIDLPNITGVIPFRELGDVKFRQTCGRAARLFGSDRTTIHNDHAARTTITEDGRVNPSSLLTKPVFWVVIPPTLSEEERQSQEELLTKLRTVYELEPSLSAAPVTSTSITAEDAESVIPEAQQTPAELSHKVAFAHTLEALLFHSGLTPDEKGSILEQLLDQEEDSWEAPPIPEITHSTEEIPHAPQDQAPLPQTSEGHAQAPVPEAVSPKPPASGRGGRRSRSASLYQRLGI
jgi:hypothetical protein